MAPDGVRIGHAFRGDGGDEDLLIQAKRIASGTETLSARAPSEAAVVTEAEELLGYSGSERPIYAFLGDIHPSLGELGLVFSRRWARRVTVGVTRCDSGGLFGGKGDFRSFGEPSERRTALRELSISGTCASEEWEAAFRNEVDASYESARAYVDGARPDSSSWGCCRASALAKLPGDRDRRLWTWEIRMVESSEPGDLEAVILPAELAKLDDPDDQMSWPEHITVIRGSASPAGAQADGTRAAFYRADARAHLAGGART